MGQLETVGMNICPYEPFIGILIYLAQQGHKQSEGEALEP